MENKKKSQLVWLRPTSSDEEPQIPDYEEQPYWPPILTNTSDSEVESEEQDNMDYKVSHKYCQGHYPVSAFPYH